MQRPTQVAAFELSWPVCIYGHEWRGDFLAEKSDPPPTDADYPIGMRNSEPLREHTALFMEFAETALKKAAVLRFADKHGLIWRDHYRPEAKELGIGNTLHEWIKAIKELRGAVDLWRAIEDGNVDVSRCGIMLRDGFLDFSPRELSRGLVKDVHLNRRDLLRGANMVLGLRINSRLEEYSLAAQLVHTANSDFQLTFQPLSLLAAMWLQFAQVVADNYTIKVCRGCGKPFQAGAGTERRADAETCSNACRQQAYLQRKEAKAKSSKKSK